MVSSRRLPRKFLIDADVLYSYFADDAHADGAGAVLLGIEERRVRGLASSIILVDLILTYRSCGAP